METKSKQNKEKENTYLNDITDNCSEINWQLPYPYPRLSLCHPALHSFVLNSS